MGFFNSAFQQAFQMAQQTPQYKNLSDWGNQFGINLPQYENKIVSPVPEANNLSNPGLLTYYKQNQAREAFVPQSDFTSQKLQYPSWIGNQPDQKQTNAIKTIRTANPNLTMSDPDIINAYNKYGDKLLTGLTPKTANIPVYNVSPTSVAQNTPTPTAFKYQDAINNVSQQTGINPLQFHLLRAGENMAENPQAINKNSNGSWDVGLFQINVDPKNIAEVERLKDPLYNTMRAGQIFKQRLNVLKDPVLAIASYNLGAGGAVLRPFDALKRAQWVYYKAGMQLPETPFTQNPLAFVKNNMDYYREIGLFKS